jgi:UDP-galactose-lipid carrier transferase
MSGRYSVTSETTRNVIARYSNAWAHHRAIAVLVLLLSDSLAIGVAERLFRAGRSVPELLFFAGPDSGREPIDVFYILCAVFLLIRYFSGDYSQRRLFWEGARATTITLLGCASITGIAQILFPERYSTIAWAGSWSFLLFAIPLFRQGARILMRWAGIWMIPTALISSRVRFEDVRKTVGDALTLGCEIRWCVLDDAPPEGGATQSSTVRALGCSRELAAGLSVAGCSQAIIATENMQSEQFSEVIHSLIQVGIGVSVIPSFRRLPLAGVTTSYFFGKDMLLLQVRNNLQHLSSRFTKRLFDITGSAALLFVLSPFFAVIALIIKLHDGGKVIYSQKRVGRNGASFMCHKFRSMAMDADARMARWREENPELYNEYMRTFKLVNDPRITALGRFLRSSSLDELPQLWNVLKGEMSLVGPRPVVDHELIEFYGPAAQLYKRVRPGLTGLWQVRGRSDTTYAERVVFDEWYILNWSFWYDIVILLQTAWIVLRRKGAY